jgi:hypothetical protein
MKAVFQVFVGLVLCVGIGAALIYSSLPIFWEHEDLQPPCLLYHLAIRRHAGCAPSSHSGHFVPSLPSCPLGSSLWGGLTCVYICKQKWRDPPKSTPPTASAGGRTRHPARVAAKLLKVTGAGTIRKQAAKRKNL